MANLEKKESKLFSGWMNYELNCACSTFYESGGAVPPLALSEEDIARLKPLVKRDVDQFYDEVSRVKLFLQELGGDEFQERRGINGEHDAFLACMKARAFCQSLYERLSLLYPESEIRNAFQNMADILEENTQITNTAYVGCL
jgi:hypothetical protein